MVASSPVVCFGAAVIHPCVQQTCLTLTTEQASVVDDGRIHTASWKSQSSPEQGQLTGALLVGSKTQRSSCVAWKLPGQAACWPLSSIASHWRWRTNGLPGQSHHQQWQVVNHCLSKADMDRHQLAKASICTETSARLSRSQCTRLLYPPRCTALLKPGQHSQSISRG